MYNKNVNKIWAVSKYSFICLYGQNHTFKVMVT